MNWLLYPGGFVTAALLLMYWPAKHDRLDTEEDLQAREAMLDKVERDWWEREGRKFRGRERPCRSRVSRLKEEMMDEAEQARLDELDREEFRDATRPLWPEGYTNEDFERSWTEFQEMKRRRAMHG